MEKVIYNLVFNRKKRLNAEGKALIQVEAYLNKQKKYFSTKIYVKPTQWDSKRKVVRNHPNTDELNQYIKDYIAYLERIELDMAQSGRSFSLSDLKETFKIAQEVKGQIVKRDLWLKLAQNLQS